MVPTSRIGLLPSNSAANECWALTGAAANRPAPATMVAKAASLAFMVRRIGGSLPQVKSLPRRSSARQPASKAGRICFDTGAGTSYDFISRGHVDDDDDET